MFETAHAGSSLSVRVCMWKSGRERGREGGDDSVEAFGTTKYENTPKDRQSIHIYNNTEIATSDLEIGRQKKKMKEKWLKERMKRG